MKPFKAWTTFLMKFHKKEIKSHKLIVNSFISVIQTKLLNKIDLNRIENRIEI